jgi:SAM-dependent methyltransferase
LRDLAQIVDRHYDRLHSSIAEDKFLSATAQVASHAFLANSTQPVYARQIEFLSVLLKEYYNLDAQQIKVLDWGCGKGHITYLLKRQGFAVTSCDIDSSRDDSSFGQETPIIDQLRIPVIPLKHQSKLPFDDATFDCVVSFGVLEHVPSDGDSVAEIRRILRLGGVFYITFLPYFLSWTQALARFRGNDYHDRLYNRGGLTQLALNARFSVCSLVLSQLFPKNSVPLSLDRFLEPMDRFLCANTPLKYFATNLEAVLLAS